MKNRSPFNSALYRAPERPLAISGPALPRWTPPQPPRDDYVITGQRPTKDITEAVFIPVYLHGTEAVGELFKYTVRVRSDIEVPSFPDLITLNPDNIVGTDVTLYVDVPGKGVFSPLFKASWSDNDFVQSANKNKN